MYMPGGDHGTTVHATASQAAKLRPASAKRQLYADGAGVARHAMRQKRVPASKRMSVRRRGLYATSALCLT